MDVIPQKGTRVSKIDIRRVEEELFLRQSLEARAVTVFMQTYNESHINRLMEYINQQEESLITQDYTSCLQYDDAFHQVFFEAIDKNICWETIVNTSGHYRRVRLMSIWDHDIFAGVIEQHRNMVENIISKNIQNVQKLFLEHSSKLVKEIEILSENTQSISRKIRKTIIYSQIFHGNKLKLCNSLYYLSLDLNFFISNVCLTFVYGMV